MNEALVALLSKIQSRLTQVAGQTRLNTDAIATLQDDVRLKVGRLQEQVTPQKWTSKTTLIRRHETLTESVAEHIDRFNRFAEEVNKREAQQTLRDQNNVQSLTNLRDSTQKAFAQVRADVTSILNTLQRLNERVGQFESQVSVLKSLKVAPSEIDQSIVNSKIMGVYNVTENLDARIAKLEDLLEKYEALRKAQAAFAEANGKFLS
jgi:vacuolar-type H+-ATPase subunit I/STV1